MSRNGRTGARDVCLDSVASYFCGRSADAINPMELSSIPTGKGRLSVSWGEKDKGKALCLS